MLTKLVSRSFVLVLLSAGLISFLKFNHCRVNDWASPDNYTHACYTDIPALFSERGLNTNTFPYLSSTNSIEYPPVIGLGNWLISFITPSENSFRTFFDINALIILVLFFISAIIVRKIAPTYQYLFPLAPAVIASLFINWDMWAVVSTLLAIYYFDKKKYEASGIWLGISIATKFFPIVLLLPIAIIFYRSSQIQLFYRYLFTTAIFWGAINIPIALTHFDGWWRFFKLNLERGADFGSIWYALSLLDIKIPYLDLIYPLLSIVLFIGLAIYLLKLPSTPNLAAIALFALVIFTTAGKVYSPQYILWLTPLAVIALQNSKQLITFWFWQATEITYHLAIWQYLALFSDAQFGLPAGGYALATIIRVIGMCTFAYILMRDLATSSTEKRD
uniref:glycosyltransferase family 87 protein n=1 Tax=Candidatus Nanopelagicus sp. TaxID=2518620 RepID=UPI0040499F5E